MVRQATLRAWALAMLAGIIPLAGCTEHKDASDKKLHVLCSTFPMYLFTLNVTQGRAGIQVEPMLPPTAGCPHEYELRPEDLRKISSADVFVINGLGMEKFLDKAKEKAKPGFQLIDSSTGIKDLIHAASDPQDINEHLFASPRMAAQVVRVIAAELGRIDPDGATLYNKNAEAYAARLEKLADEFAAAAKRFVTTRIVTEHEIFDYLARDCGLDIVAVVEENPGREPKAAEMSKIIKEIRKTGAAAVFTEPQYSADAGKKIAEGANVPVAVLDPVASGPDAPPLDYYETKMRENMETLKKYLGQKEVR